MRYAIYEDLFNTVEKKLKRVQKKCEKHGNPFKFNIVDTEIREVKDENSFVKYYKFFIVDVEGAAKIDNYEIVAMLEIYDKGNVVKRINNEVEIPERFWTTKNICEHCNSKRHRKNLYIVRNVITNEYKQVGSDCLQLYTNGLNAEYAAAYIDGITELEEFDGVFSGSGSNNYLPVKEVLGYATELVNKMGYFNSNADLPTRTLLSEFFGYNSRNVIEKINRNLHDFKFDITVSASDFNKVETDKEVDKIIEYYLGIEANTEFNRNIKSILNEGYVRWENMGLLAYLPEGYNQHIKKEVAKAKQIEINNKSEYFGEVGKRYKKIEVFDLRILTNWFTQYGTTYMYQITTTDGNILIWKSSNWYDNLDSYKSIDFSVKEHSEFRDTKQTVVTRCKLYK